MAILLTKAKAARSTGKTIKGQRLVTNAAVQDRYVQELQKLVQRMTYVATRETLKLYNTDTAEQFFAMDASITAKAKKLNNALKKTFSQLFALTAPRIAEKMVRDTEKASTSTLHSSLEKMSGGLSLKTSVVTGDMEEQAKAMVTYNVNLIKTIADDYLDNVNGLVLRSITTGSGLQDLIPQLEKYSDGTMNKAKNLALDQTRKAYATISAGKAQKLGVTHYEWIHSGGGIEPRKLHMAYDGRIFRFDDPPIIDERTKERGIPSQAINCKCTMRPVISFDD